MNLLRKGDGPIYPESPAGPIIKKLPATRAFDEQGKEIFPAGQGDPGAKAYAPPQIRGLDQPTRTVKTFSELLTRELDDIVAAAEAEIAALKSEAQGVRDMYTTYTDGIAEDIKRLQEGVALSMKTMLSLREQCEALNAKVPVASPDQKEIPF